ncbi:AraC family ligand binding domain-containing protein [Hymenobacter volaticus]|uniref:AraC family ligand binding domain-containing protein n=1 Tax=Hymenobacter volaticus TaxID=2932254 RepID=A0ABY4G1U2_9BACT|nr:AraC family ligand binding domain-containing protein [Hymenobacter volaticus]UOQ64639.1 AraC family ligand binding domain-containing protein [Hymenobacter volaticus]
MSTLPSHRPINTYNTSSLLTRFMPDASAFDNLRRVGSEWFFVVAVEQMYVHFTQGIPPSRATAHSCLYLTSGTARMSIGNETYTIHPQQVLVVRAGQVYSFEPGDQNTGFLLHFHDDMLLGKTAPTDAPNPFEFLQFWGVRISRSTPKRPGSSRTCCSVYSQNSILTSCSIQIFCGLIYWLCSTS